MRHPIQKISKARRTGGYDSMVGAPAWQLQDPEFKSQKKNFDLPWHLLNVQIN
jgi:hypothetical protein